MEDREYKKVIDYVKEEIKAGKLGVDDRLPTERALAEKLVMSRGSVREALRTMGNIGILESKQGSGNYLKSDLNKTFAESIGMMFLLKQINARDILIFRRAVEIEAYRLAITNMTTEEKEQLAKILQQMKTLKGKEQIAKDKEFHYLIINASGNGLMIRIMEAIDEVYEQSVARALEQATDKKKREIIDTHQRMLKGLQDRNVEFGIRALKKHYDTIN